MNLETIDCIKDCSGACCKIMLMRIKGQLPEDYATARDIGTIGPFLWFRYQCKYLTETGKCSIYDSRPSLCREQPAGCEECLACREIDRTGGI